MCKIEETDSNQRTELWTPAVTNKMVLQIDQEKALGVALTKPAVPKMKL